MTTLLPALARLRRIEADALAAGLPLMERAGRAAANLVLHEYPQARRALVLMGPGNNGGDGLVCARHLKAAGIAVAICPIDGVADFGHCDLIVDALFGIGLARDLAGAARTLVETANASGKPIVALDTPSGLDAYTGTVKGCAIRAEHTLTFLADKPGLHTGAGRDHAGTVCVDPLGLGLELEADPADGELVDSAPTALRKLRRLADTHKGQFGTVAIFGGAPGMLGAPLLAGRAALKFGAGKVRLGFLADDHPAFDPLQPELMLHPAAELETLADTTLLVAGPGLGQSDAAKALLERLLLREQPLVLDADALNLIAADPALQTRLRQRTKPAVLTPHPAEAARLLAQLTIRVQADRIAAAQELAQRLNCVVLLKGAGTVCSDGQRWSINASGNAALSNAGQGDALAGMLAALFAQGLEGFEAARCAAWLHGAAADQWRTHHPAGIGLSASEATDLAREWLNRLAG